MEIETIKTEVVITVTTEEIAVAIEVASMIVTPAVEAVAVLIAHRNIRTDFGIEKVGMINREYTREQ